MKKINKKLVISSSLILCGALLTSAFLSYNKNNEVKRNSSLNNINNDSLDSQLKEKSSNDFEAMNLTAGQTVTVKDPFSTIDQYNIYTTRAEDFEIDQNKKLIGFNRMFVMPLGVDYINLLIPEGVVSIGDSAFSTSIGSNKVISSRIVRVDLRSSTLTSLGNFVFTSDISTNFSLHSKIKEVVFGVNKLTTIPQSTFAFCSRLFKIRNFENQDSLNVIQTNAFLGTSIKEAKTPKNITRIEEGAFSHIANMNYFDASASTVLSNIGPYVFRDSRINHIFIPDGNNLDINQFAFFPTTPDPSDPKNYFHKIKNVNLPTKFSFDKLFSLGIFDNQGKQWFGTPPIQQLDISFDKAKFYNDYVKNGNSIELSLKQLSEAPKSTLTKYLILNNSPEPSLIPMSYLRNISSTYDATNKKLIITPVVNKFYSLKTPTIEVASDFLPSIKTEFTSSLLNKELKIAHDKTNIAKFKEEALAEIELWKVSIDKTDFTPYKLLNELKLSIVNPTSNMTLEYSDVFNEKANCLIVTLTLNGSLKLNFSVFFAENPTLYTEFKTTNTTNNVIDLSGVANCDSSKMDEFIAETQRQITEWETNKTDNFANLTILNKLELSASNYSTNSKIEKTITKNTSNNSLTLTLKMTNARVNSNPAGTISITFEILFAPSKTTTLTTDETNLIKNWTTYNKSEIQTLLDNLTTEVNAWTPQNPITTTNTILNALGVTITNPTSSSKLTFTSSTPNAHTVAIKLKLSNAYINESSTNADLYLDFTIFFKDESITTFESTLSNKTLDLTQNVDKTQMQAFENELISEITEWNKTKPTDVSTFRILKEFGLVLTNTTNTELVANVIKDINNDTKLTITLTLKGGYLTPSTTQDLSQTFVVNFKEKANTTFATSLINNTWDLTSQSTDIIPQFNAQLTQEVETWNQSSNKTDFTSYNILSNLGLSVSNLTDASTLEVSTPSLIGTSNVLGFSLTLKNAFIDNASTGSIKLSFNVVLHKTPTPDTTFTTTRNNKVIQIPEISKEKINTLKTDLQTEIDTWNSSSSKNLEFTNSKILKWLGLKVNNLGANTQLANPTFTENLDNASLEIKLTLVNAYNSGATNYQIPLNFNILFKNTEATTFTTSSQPNIDFTLLDKSQIESVKNEITKEVEAWNNSNKTDLTFSNFPLLKELKLNITNIKENTKLKAPEFVVDTTNNTLGLSLTLENAYSNGSYTNSITHNFTFMFKKDSLAPEFGFSTNLKNKILDLKNYELNKVNAENFLSKLNLEIENWNKDPNVGSYQILDALKLRIPSSFQNPQLKLVSASSMNNNETREISFKIALMNQKHNTEINFVAQFKLPPKNQAAFSNSEMLIYFGAPAIAILLIIIAIISGMIIIRKTRTIK